ncbi:MAG: hypothetical protein JWN97_2206, partial [Nocardioides sp.]|nr:hypothetical protein [Nocardioides sp.]
MTRTPLLAALVATGVLALTACGGAARTPATAEREL